jgi:hypothetical protein
MELHDSTKSRDRVDSISLRVREIPVSKHRPTPDNSDPRILVVFLLLSRRVLG